MFVYDRECFLLIDRGGVTCLVLLWLLSVCISLEVGGEGIEIEGRVRRKRGMKKGRGKVTDEMTENGKQKLFVSQWDVLTLMPFMEPLHESRTLTPVFPFFSGVTYK